MSRLALLVILLLPLAACSLDMSRTSVDDVGARRNASIPLDHLPALAGDYLPITSTHSGRTYHVYVRLPEGYDPQEARRYPVVYLLDGDSLFPLLAPTHLLLTYDEDLPEAILVGIVYGGFDPSVNKRDMDFSAPAPDAAAGEGGAPAFLQFLARELIPEVEKRYRADASRRVLLGQSRGGTFVLWSALEAPDLFWGRIASNPTLLPGRERFFIDAAPHARGDLQVAVASGSRDTERRQRNAVEWTQAWSGRSDAPWQVALLPIEGGTHAASIGEAYRQAMLWLFRDE
ncbi:alpha/beta hydrolase [Luteimonas salinilitoris]|uniref:Alpha/beta hydrolase n=1 Tax=Luteimonas salinilitoris TaxID=3237697 RepID=A0ABV4HPW5_9GAMM